MDAASSTTEDDTEDASLAKSSLHDRNTEVRSNSAAFEYDLAIMGGEIEMWHVLYVLRTEY